MLAALLGLSGCATNFDDYPQELKEFHLVQVKSKPLSDNIMKFVSNPNDVPLATGQVIRCMRFEVRGVNPFNFKFDKVVPVENCHEVAGYKAKENMVLWNWIDDTIKGISTSTCYERQNP